jgi:hypothetical protein
VGSDNGDTGRSHSNLGPDNVRIAIEISGRSRAGTPPSVRWQKLKKRKIVELDAMLEHIQSMRDLLERQGNCRCTALEECGKKMFEKHCAKRLF